jgi:hypothetical protein
MRSGGVHADVREDSEMAVIEGVVASVHFGGGHSVLTVYPIQAEPERRIAPEHALDLTLRREPWQTDESHRDHVRHMVGQGGFIEYAETGNIIATIRAQ